MWFDFDLNDAEIIGGTIITHLQPLVPPSTTVLKIDHSGLGLTELRWREFLISHPEVNSVECADFSDESICGSLWDALSPTGTYAIPPCPKLESISLSGDPASTQLLDCLLSRKNAGFELKLLKVSGTVGGLAVEFSHLVEALEANMPEDISKWEMGREVRPISWMSFACNDSSLVEGISVYGLS